MTRGRSKLVEIQHGWIGLVGSSTHQLTLKSLLKNKADQEDFSTVDGIFETLLSFQRTLTTDYFLQEEEPDEEQPYNSCQMTGLVCTRNGIFGFGSYREVCEYERFWAIGSGDTLAIGAMHAAYDLYTDPEEIARIGALAACEFDSLCGPPVESKSITLS